jgi:hypothetical protein
MKKRKELIIAFGIIMLATVIFAGSVPNVFSPGTVAKSSQVNENFNYLTDHLLTRTVIEGTINTNQDGDVVKTVISGSSTNLCHWKIIEVPQIVMTNMPMVWVYMKSTPNAADMPSTNNWMPLDFTSWCVLNDASTRGRETPCFIVDEGKVYIYFKRGAISTTTGEYKIIIIK